MIAKAATTAKASMIDEDTAPCCVAKAAHGAAREEAARGVGAPASDRAGVWGGAPR